MCRSLATTLTSVSLALEWREDNELTTGSVDFSATVVSRIASTLSPQSHPYHIRVTPERISRRITCEMIALLASRLVMWSDFKPGTTRQCRSNHDASVNKHNHPQPSTVTQNSQQEKLPLILILLNITSSLDVQQDEHLRSSMKFPETGGIEFAVPNPVFHIILIVIC